jgi:hypothetical protein
MNNSLVRAYRNKITNKLYGVVYMPHRGRQRGAILLSYLTAPFTQAPGKLPTDPHAGYWECGEIVRLLTERGYDVDIIDWKNESFIPRKPYKACIDIQKNLKRLSPHLKNDCLKIMHIVSSYAEFQNTQEQKRLNAIKERRGVSLKPRRIDSVSDNPAFADILEGFGNSTVHATYARFGKQIHPIPESVSSEFPFPDTKDFAEARKNFLWFGGGGAVHKGLDLILEAWTGLPAELTLHIVGPIKAEDDFMDAYKTELSLPNVFVHSRPKTDTSGNMTVDGKPFGTITDSCANLLYFSCSEGTSGAVVQSMHAGLIPIITPESGIYEDAPTITVSNPTVSKIREEVLRVSQSEPQELKKHAQKVWQYARSRYTKKTFSAGYADFIDTIANL